ncbi:MAG: ABC transporter ATP-binding protein [Clostridia bacterium]|nr:ABC transporter ATP-binding protein [Clostridia bacterium]
MEAIIDIKNVTKIYKVGSERITALDGVNLQIQKGEFCCLLGTSGSGKSTLLNVMAGIEKLTSGDIIIRNKKINKMSENELSIFRQKYLGFIFQAYNLIPSLTAMENVELPLIFKEIPPKKRLKMVKEIIRAVGLTGRAKHKPSQMSGGQQQRVGIARAFVASPEIIFADEPTGNLDTKTTMEIMNLIKEMSKKYNQTIVMVTHDVRIAEFADKVVHIHDGKIIKIEEKSIAE